MRAGRAGKVNMDVATRSSLTSSLSNHHQVEQVRPARALGIKRVPG